MELGPSLHNLGALITAGLGLAALLRPDWAASFVRVRPDGPLGHSELRATYGGLFAALGAFCIYGQDPVAFAVLGAGWLGAAGGRIFSIARDPGTREARNFAAVAFEAALAGLLLAPA